MESTISFQNEDVSTVLKNKKRLRAWITAVIKSKKRTPGEIAFVFCSDEYLLQLNKQYLNHDTYTDIITFDYSKEDKNLPVSGDIFISVDRVKENAKKFSKKYTEELHRVMIHGVLHLLGYADKRKDQKAEMTLQEDLCLKKLGKLNNL